MVLLVLTLLNCVRPDPAHPHNTALYQGGEGEGEGVGARLASYIRSALPLSQVLQFGRIENGSFILDFQAPFSPVQAFSVALANLC